MLDAAVAFSPPLLCTHGDMASGSGGDSAPAASAICRADSGTRALEWVEPAESFWLISIRNLGLTLASFGVYHFWGRAQARRQVVNSIRLGGKPLDYSGTGLEGFISFVIGAVVAVSVVAAFLLMFASLGEAGSGAMQEFRWRRLTISIPLLFLLGSVIYRKRQHLLRRTWWQGERFDLSGQAWGYAWQHFWSAFLVPLTLGWAAPWRAHRLERRKIDEMHHGGRTFHAEAGISSLYRAFAVLWFGGGVMYLLTMVLIGLAIGPQILEALQGLTLAPLNDADVLKRGAVVLILGLTPVLILATYYRAVWIEHLLSSIRFGEARFRAELPKLPFVSLMLSNLALKVLSLGVLTPVVDARLARFLIAHCTIDGKLPLAHPSRA